MAEKKNELPNYEIGKKKGVKMTTGRKGLDANQSDEQIKIKSRKNM